MAEISVEMKILKCLSCGKDAVPKDRRVLKSASASTIIPFLKSTLLRRLRTITTDFIESELDTLINKSFMCRSCFDSYKTHVNKGEKLYNLTVNSVEVLVTHCQQQVETVPASASHHASEDILVATHTTPCRSIGISDGSGNAVIAVQHSRKRLYSQIDDNSNSSPSVSVSLLYMLKGLANNNGPIPCSSLVDSAARLTLAVVGMVCARWVG